LLLSYKDRPSLIFYIYKSLGPRKKIRNRKKERAAKTFFNKIKHQTSLIYENGGWLMGEGAGRHVQGTVTPT
jgi:hypothetical protein